MIQNLPNTCALPSAPTISPVPEPVTLTMDQMQYVHARRVLDQVHGNKLRAAKLLGISRMTLYRLLSRHRPAEPAIRTN